MCYRKLKTQAEILRNSVRCYPQFHSIQKSVKSQPQDVGKEQRMYSKYAELKAAMGVKDIDVSRATGVSPSTLSDWKNGHYTPKADKLKKIADFFKVSLSELLES